MAKGKKTGGRQKGVPNRVTTSVKQAITAPFIHTPWIDGEKDAQGVAAQRPFYFDHVAELTDRAFDELGGVPSLVAWGKKNPNEFYGLWGRLAPREVHADVTVKLSPEERARRVAQILGVAK